MALVCVNVPVQIKTEQIHIKITGFLLFLGCKQLSGWLIFTDSSLISENQHCVLIAVFVAVLWLVMLIYNSKRHKKGEFSQFTDFRTLYE